MYGYYYYYYYYHCYVFSLSRPYKSLFNNPFSPAESTPSGACAPVMVSFFLPNDRLIDTNRLVKNSYPNGVFGAPCVCVCEKTSHRLLHRPTHYGALPLRHRRRPHRNNKFDKKKKKIKNARSNQKSVVTIHTLTHIIYIYTSPAVFIVFR